MKKRTIAVFGVLLVCVLCVFALGLSNKRNREQEQQTAGTEAGTGTAAEAGVSGSDEEKEYFDQVAKDAEQVEKEGLIFEWGEYRSRGGFGYQITDFKLYDTYDELQIENYDEKKKGETAPNYPESDYACLELRVTNEGERESVFYTLRPTLIIAENGLRGEPQTDGSPVCWCTCSRMIYVEGIEDPQDDPKNTINPVIGAGETLTLKLYFECFVEAVDENNKLVTEGIKDRMENPEYYLQIPGLEDSGDPNFLFDITKDRHYIYLKCTPEE